MSGRGLGSFHLRLIWYTLVHHVSRAGILFSSFSNSPSPVQNLF